MVGVHRYGEFCGSLTLSIWQPWMPRKVFPLSITGQPSSNYSCIGLMMIIWLNDMYEEWFYNRFTMFKIIASDDDRVEWYDMSRKAVTVETDGGEEEAFTYFLVTITMISWVMNIMRGIMVLITLNIPPCSLLYWYLPTIVGFFMVRICR